VFGSGQIKARLDWNRIGEPAFQVEESIDDSREQLGAMCSVWYMGADGAPADWSAAGARPLSMHEAANPDIAWSDHRAERLATFEECFASANEPIQLILPAYGVGHGRRLILDGTHRAVAAYRAAVPVALFVFALRGPVDPAVLPDLMHYV
jgi:hypothetical protein